MSNEKVHFEGENQKPSYYSILTANVRYSKVLNDFEKILYSELTCLSNLNGYASASNDYLAYVFGKSVRTIARSLEKMKKHGFIRVETVRQGKEIVARKIFVISEAEQKSLSNFNSSFSEKDTDKNVTSSTGDRDKNGIAKFGIAKNGVVNNTSLFNNTSNNNIKDKYIVDSEKTAPEIDNAPLNQNDELIKQIIEYLNTVTNSKYRYKTPATKKMLNARIKEGYEFKDFKHVIDIKAAQWLNSDMEKFLRPNTLFSNSKFENYVNEKPFKGRRNVSNNKTHNESPKQEKRVKTNVNRLKPLMDYANITTDVKQFESLVKEFEKRYPNGEGLNSDYLNIKGTETFTQSERQFASYAKIELSNDRGEWIINAMMGQTI